MYKLPEQELSDIVRGVKAQPDKWALLARHNREIDHVELAFIKAKIPYIRPRKDSVWSSRTADVLIALLESLFTDDPAPLLSRTLASLCLLTADECPEGGTPRDIFDAIRVALEKDLFAPRVYGALNRLPQVWTGWKRDLHHFEPQYIITSVAKWASAIIDVKEHKLLESLRDALIRRKGSLKSRIERQLNGLENNNGVALSTMHGSKGREFQCVWIYALNKRIDIRLEDIEEERRLNYVAFTRAKRTLMISCSLPEGPAEAFAEAGLTPRMPHLFLKSRAVRSPGQSGPQQPGNNPDNNSKPKRKRRSLLD